MPYTSAHRQRVPTRLSSFACSLAIQTFARPAYALLHALWHTYHSATQPRVSTTPVKIPALVKPSSKHTSLYTCYTLLIDYCHALSVLPPLYTREWAEHTQILRPRAHANSRCEHWQSPLPRLQKTSVYNRLRILQRKRQPSVTFASSSIAFTDVYVGFARTPRNH